MKWHIHNGDGGRYAVYDLRHAGSEDRGDAVKIEGFLPDRQFWGGVSIYPYDEYRRVHEAETWYRTRLARICIGDSEYATSLLNYVVDLRCGTITPEAQPPTPPGGRVMMVPDDYTVEGQGDEPNTD